MCFGSQLYLDRPLAFGLQLWTTRPQAEAPQSDYAEQDQGGWFGNASNEIIRLRPIRNSHVFQLNQRYSRRRKESCRNVCREMNPRE